MPTPTPPETHCSPETSECMLIPRAQCTALQARAAITRLGSLLRSGCTSQRPQGRRPQALLLAEGFGGTQGSRVQRRPEGARQAHPDREQAHECKRAPLELHGQVRDEIYLGAEGKAVR